ncbi:MAG TPA: hypothetical protein VF223_04865 [Trebonia sp.]
MAETRGRGGSGNAGHGWTVGPSAKYVYQESTSTGTFGKPNNKPRRRSAASALRGDLGWSGRWSRG